MRAVLVVIVVGGVAWAAPPSLLWEAKLLWTLPTATPVWSATLSLDWAIAGWELTGKASFADGAWKGLTVSSSGHLGTVRLAPSLEFDPQASGFRALTVPWKLDFLGLTTEGVTRLEERGFGWGLTFLGPKDSPVERIRLRFNLKRFLDEVLEDTFAPSFAFGEIRFALRLPCCVERVRGWLNLTKAGFSDFGVSFALPIPRETGITLFSVVRFSVDKKSVFLGPGFIYDVPPCVQAFLGLDWDQATWTIKGIKAYAVGWHCQVGEVRVRWLAAFEDIGLVKRPYREALWVTWEGGGCCGPAKFTAAAYFGEGGFLFGLGEVEVGAEVPLAPTAVIGLGPEFPLAGAVKVALSWKIEL